MKTKSRPIRVGESINLPIHRADGEELHAIRANSGYLVLLSPMAFKAFKQYKVDPRAIGQESVNLLNLALDQAGFARMEAV